MEKNIFEDYYFYRDFYEKIKENGFVTGYFGKIYAVDETKALSELKEEIEMLIDEKHLYHSFKYKMENMSLLGIIRWYFNKK